MIEIERIPKDAWIAMSEKAHLIAFDTHKPVETERIDFACLIKCGHQLLGYGTFKEMDSGTLYWQFGGAFPGTKDSSMSFKGYQALVDWCGRKYERVYTYIENTNLVMLKFAMKVGYRITGIRNYKGNILLEHLLEFKE